ncbi:ABC transporter ATP-binding protein [Promicromonospora soli]
MAGALEFDGVAKSFGSTRALVDATFRVEEGTVHCLLGENGAGKSTVCNLISGSLVADRGRLHLFGEEYRPTRPANALDRGVAMVHQHFSLVPTMTVEENLLLHGRRHGLGRRDLRARLAAVADEFGLEVTVSERVKDLPVGLRQQVEIVRALLSDPRLLVLDEPTGVLAPAEVGALLASCRRLADAGRTVILVSHKIGDIVGAGDCATILRAGQVVANLDLATTDRAALVRLMVGRSSTSFDPVLASSLGIGGGGSREGLVMGQDSTPRDRGPVVLEVDEIDVRRSDGALALDNVSLQAWPGEIVGIAGVDGNGQSELAMVLAGVLSPDNGRVRLGGVPLDGMGPGKRAEQGLGVIPEDRLSEGCIPELSVADNVFLGRLARFRRFGLVRRRLLNRAAGDLLADFDVRYAGPSAPMRSLSGGNQQKVVLARELSLDPLRCVVASQPTRGLDVGAVNAVLRRLREAAERGVAVVILSSELDELMAVCDRIVVAFRGALVGHVTPSAPGAREQIGRLMTGAEQ